MKQSDSVLYFLLFAVVLWPAYGGAGQDPVFGGRDGADASRPIIELRQPFPIDKANRKRFSPHIDRIARRYQLDPALVHAVISAESGYEPNAVSRKGAIGLMQLMPETAARYGIADPFDPVANIRGGVRHLRVLIGRFKNIRLALAAYNAGTGVVVRYGNRVPPFMETRRFIIRVIHFYMLYKKAL